MGELLHILGDPAHWAFEAISDVVFGMAAYPVAKWRLRRHDRTTHKIG